MVKLLGNAVKTGEIQIQHLLKLNKYRWRWKRSKCWIQIQHLLKLNKIDNAHLHKTQNIQIQHLLKLNYQKNL